jgi:small subunit ribosomal protein S27Ae
MSESAETAEKPAEEKPTEEEPISEEPPEAKPTEAKPAEVKPKKKKSKNTYSYYKVEEDKIKRMLPFCERCGPGYFMADHGNRYTCGHCGFTRYKPAETSK